MIRRRPVSRKALTRTSRPKRATIPKRVMDGLFWLAFESGADQYDLHDEDRKALDAATEWILRKWNAQCVSGLR